MKLSEFSVNRPVTVSMFFLGVLLMGVISLSRLPRELFPSITYPQLTVVTTYENAAPEEIETLITKIIEETVGTVSNLKRISSISKEGVSIVTAEFNWGTNMDFASLGVREKIDLIKERLPLGSSDPIVMKFNPFELPVMTLSITGDKSPSELLRFSRRFIKDELDKVMGVASSNIVGGLEREIRVSIDNGRLLASHVSITSVVDALKSSNLNYPAGTIEEHFYEYLIRTMGEFKVVPEIEETVVGKDEVKNAPPQGERDERSLDKSSRLVYLKDIAQIKDTFQERTSISRYNGQENISVSIQKQAGANTMQVAQKVRERLDSIKKNMPKGMQVKIVYDQSIFIKQSIRGVMEAAIQGGILAFLVLFVFLRNVKAALIVAFSMPISIMVAFSLMYFNGITINMLSLGGLALGIGMLVDNAIVVIENIYGHFQKTPDIKEASKTGASEMAGAIFSSTLTTVAVFLPMVFVVGVAGQLFKELAFTVTFSLIASLIIALSLIPRLSSIKTSRSEKKENVINTKVLFGLDDLYAKIIPKVLKYRWLFLGIILIVFLLSTILFVFVDKEFMPKIDQREFVMKVNMQTGTRLDITDKVVKKIEGVLLGMEDVEGAAVNIGSSKSKDLSQGIETLGAHQSQIIVTLKKEKIWPPTSKMIERLKDNLNRINLEGAEIEYILQESIFKSALQGSAPIVLEIKGKELKRIESLSKSLKDSLSEIEGIYGIRTSLTNPSPETKVNVIRDKAALYNLSTGVISQAAHTAIKGVVATKFKEGGREIDVRVSLRKEDRARLSQVRNVLIHSPLDIEVPLSEVAYIAQGLGPSEIKRLDQQRVVLVTANIADRALDKVIADINSLIQRKEDEITLESIGKAGREEKDITISLSGESQQMGESFNSLKFALLLSILLVYMIMASQFESLWQPFIIMFTVPLSLIGVLAALFLTHTPISVVVILGFIILGGIVVNNGIILIDSINRLREKGLSLVDSVVESGKSRLRPILMTTSTTVLGLLPLALGVSEGSELQSPMAITVMGGLLVSTVLTLFVIPCIYTITAMMLGVKTSLKKPVLLKARTVPEKKLEEEKTIILPPPEPEMELPSPEEVKPREEEQLAKKDKIDSIPPIEAALPRVNKRQNAIVEYLKEKKTITRKEYARLFNVSIPTAARDLKELLDKGIVAAHGPLGPGRWYELKGKS